MNVLELIMYCHDIIRKGENKHHVKRMFNQMGVDDMVQKEILELFDDNGNFITGIGEIYKIEFKTHNIEVKEKKMSDHVFFENENVFCKDFINNLIDKLNKDHSKVNEVKTVRFFSETDTLMEVNALCENGDYYRISASDKDYFQSFILGG
jgi:hypothetical protein